uniref:NADH-ubiquinone oxidoreductase chain 3 n=1 Tax=Ophiopholis mirabilis TaxID=2705304 RepID=A0A6C0FCT7_9ECHI|nr:NADH dehydrogenase subunit 3 [Ophiopholis mirabilis]QHT54266.1 NADH dehydrogenase subunit 3 [Ophiopholis mirabilis]
MITNYVITMLILTLVLTILGRTLPSLTPDLNKVSPYECGFDPINSARLPFSFRFFLVAILFLIFDLEIALLLVLPLLVPSTNSFNAGTILLIFLAILTIGLWYEWENGGLDWVE